MEDYNYTIGDTLLHVDKVNVSYDGKPILRDLEMKVSDLIRPGHTQGQVDAVLAPSGTGKTVLFRTISGLKKPDSGQVLMGDKTVVPGMVGVVAQDYPLFNHLTVLDNMLLAAKVRFKDHKSALEASMTMLAQFELDGKVKSYPAELSGGQRQRVAILQQMVSCGHLLLMDEPFSGLDILMKQKAQTMITDLAAADELNSIIITTHDIESAVSVADTIVLIGRERDEAGNPIPGATVRYTYNLVDMGLAWHPDIERIPAFDALVKEIKARFREL